jgi:hypothetical protein
MPGSLSRAALCGSSALALLALVGCGPAHEPAPIRAAVDLEPSLVLPPTQQTEAALSQLRSAARKGSCRAAWLRLRYLMDLFDWVRLLPEQDAGSALPLLWSTCELPGTAARGRMATRQVLDAIAELHADAVRRCPLEGAEGRQLALFNEMLRADQASRSSPREALAVAVAYKRIAAGPSALAANAQLRLVDWCAKAFRLAAGGNPALQHTRLSQCLFPLLPADPAPYFDENPAGRPTDPPWPTLRKLLDRERDKLANTRLAPLARRLAELDRAFFSMAAAALPAPLNLAAFKLPLSEAGDPWERTPIVMVTAKGYIAGGRAVLEDDDAALEQAIAHRLHNDRRRRLTVVAESGTLAPRILAAAKAARRAGAATLELGVARRVAAKAPPGDVQASIFGAGPVLRLEGIPLSLDLLSSTTVTPGRDLPRGLGYDPRTARGQLALLMIRGSLQVLSRDGRLAPIRSQHLADQLETLRRAYPEDRSLVLAPDPAILYEELVAVAGTARRRGRQLLFPGLALASPAQVSAPDKELAPLLRILAVATVLAEPEPNRTLPMLARGCYLETLRDFVGPRRRPPEGTLRLGPTRGGLKIVGGSLRHPGLRRCVAKQLASMENAQKITLTFKLER